jgi:F-type H+-transporting ATPase subunit epsilon
MKGFALEIRSPAREIFFGQVTSLRAKALDGELGILADHAPLATVLDKGEVSYLPTDGELKELNIKGGFLLVKNNHAQILVPEF